MSYKDVGSGEGVRRFLARSVDFGASDGALTDEQMAGVERGVRLIPVTAGMVVLAYNLPRLGGGKIAAQACAGMPVVSTQGK